jgi:hypothetical protein
VRIFRGPLSGELHAEDAVAVLTSNYSESTTGTALSSGDFNGDDIVDMAVGQSELRAVVIFAGPLAGELSEEDALSQIYRETGFDGFSKFGSVMGAGDLNGDGKLDLAVGAPQSSTKESTTVGVVEIFFGPFQGTRTVKAGDVELTSGISYDYFGKSLVIRDLNEDGALDLLAGAPSNVYPLAGSNRGCFYTYYGPFEGDGTGADPVLLACASSLYTESGLSLTVGELNGHEGLDVLVGAPSLSDDSTLGGGARLVDHSLLP